MKRIISLVLILVITMSSFQVCLATSVETPWEYYQQPVYGYGAVPVQPKTQPSTPIYITVNGGQNSKGISPATLLIIIGVGAVLCYNYRETIEKYAKILMATYCVKKITEAVGYVGIAFGYITPLLDTLGAAGMSFLSFLVKHLSPGIKTTK